MTGAPPNAATNAYLAKNLATTKLIYRAYPGGLVDVMSRTRAAMA